MFKLDLEKAEGGKERGEERERETRGEPECQETRPGIQAASCVGPGKSTLPFELRRKAGDCSRVTAGPIDLI